ncbi:hypothetical protein E4T56_gene4674 [Termitomyces sp. T112]|nr:hypothetical protein E4T56_gene4674 [Termitomyces sp. T112]
MSAPDVDFATISLAYMNNDLNEAYVIVPSSRSSFTNNLLWQDDVACIARHYLNSQTDQNQHVVYTHPYRPGNRVIVIDALGSDHTTVDDREILRRIVVWLARSY